MNQEKEIVLKMLAELEAFRKNIEEGKINPGNADWTIRMCQAFIAKGHFETMVDWKNALLINNITDFEFGRIFGIQDFIDNQGNKKYRVMEQFLDENLEAYYERAKDSSEQYDTEDEANPFIKSNL